MSLDQDKKRWIRWLHDECLLPLEHVADVLELDLAIVADLIAWHGKGRRPRRPTGPPRKGERADRRGLPILGQSGTKIKRLRALGYQPTPIAGMLGLAVDDVKDFIRRLEPIRRGRLSRPRSRVEQLAIRPTLPPAPPLRRMDPLADAWNWRARPEPPAVPPVVAIPVEADDQVVVEARARTPEQPSPHAWVGRNDLYERRGGRTKFSDAQADELRRECAAGATIYELAAKYKCERNTIYAALKRKPDATPSPPPPVETENETAHAE